MGAARTIAAQVAEASAAVQTLKIRGKKHDSMATADYHRENHGGEKVELCCYLSIE